VDSLLTGQPRYVSDDPSTAELVTIIERLPTDARDRVLHLARLEALAVKSTTDQEVVTSRKPTRIGNKRA
jgi:hypothetical protein